MVRIYRKASGAGTWHVRHPVSVILAAAGVVILALVGSACSHADAANPSIAASGAGRNNGPDCPTDGVGGDSLPPPCIPSAGSSPRATIGTVTHADGTQRTGTVAAGSRPNVVVAAPGDHVSAGSGPLRSCYRSSYSFSAGLRRSRSCCPIITSTPHEPTSRDAIAGNRYFTSDRDRGRRYQCHGYR